MKKTILLTDEEEMVFVSAIIDAKISLQADLAALKDVASDYSSSERKRFRADQRAKRIEEEIPVLSLILDRLSKAGYEIEEEEG